jgi:ligand-binding sensor domain-containing protein
MGFINGLPESHQGTRMSTTAQSIYVGIDDELYRKAGNRFEFVHQKVGSQFQFAASGEEGLLTGWKQQNSDKIEKILIDPAGGKKQVNNCSGNAQDAIVDSENRVWYADLGKGFKYSMGFTGACQTITPDRPPTHNAAQIATFNKRLYVATGGITINYGYLFRTEGFYTNENDQWTSYTKDNVDALKEKDMRDIVCVEAADDGTIYLGTFWDGLIKYKDGEVVVFDKDNSSLQNSVINPDRNRITDLTFDAKGNLWILNHDAPKPLSVLTKEGEWMSFNLPTNTNVEHIAVDQMGHKWISIGGIGLVVFDSGEDILSTSDDRYLLFNSSNSELTANSINDIAADRDGGVWVGSTEGLVFFFLWQF